MFKYLIRIAYIITILLFFLYSYTQVDLSLTLTGNSQFTKIQNAFQHVGYFQRPVSAIIFIVLFTILFIFYIYFLKNRKIFNKGTHILILLIVVSLILLFSYPAFSYDIFNYLFTAKSVVIYFKNPYFVNPLDFYTIDNWISFMRWTHLPSAYSPLWILLTLPIYLLTFGKLLAILYLMKMIAIVSYLLTAYFIYKILDIIRPADKFNGVIFFALNPLIIIEVLVSAHNDILMMMFFIFSIYLLVNKKYVSSFFTYALSIGLKTMTIFSIFSLIYMFINKKYKISKVLYIQLLGMILGLILVGTQREILGWYLVWIIPIASLVNSKFINRILIFYSLALGLNYAPYLWYGFWDEPVYSIRKNLIIIFLTVGLVFAVLGKIKDYYFNSSLKVR